MAEEKIIVLTNNRSDRLNDVALALGLAGYEVHIVNTKEDLIEFSLRERSVLIIKDILSLAICDVETIRSLRSDDELSVIPILVIGEVGETSVTVVEVLNAGAAGYIKLPVEPLLLVKRLTQLVEQKRNEKIIGNQETYLRALIENGTDIITVLTTEGKIIYESQSIENRLGYTSNELIGRNCLEFIHSDDRQTVFDYYQEGVRQNGFTQPPLKYHFRHKNGSWRVLESVCNFVKDSLEELVIVVNSRDITRRRSEEKSHQRLQNKLVEAESRFKLSLQTARMIWWEWNPQRDEIILADNFAEIYGAPNIKIANEGFSLLHPEDEKRHTSLVERIAKTGKSYRSEFRIIRRDNGETVWLEETASAFFDEKGKVHKVVGIAIDITDRKRSENAVRESETRFKTQYTELPIPAYTWKKSGDDFILVDFNKIAEDISEGKMPEFLGTKASEMFADSPKIHSAIHECFEQKKSISFEMPYTSRIKDKIKQLIFDFVYIPSDSVMIYTLDVTEFRQTIDSLKKSENRFQLVARATNDVLWDWNLKNDDLWWNENISRVFGYKEEEISSKTDFWHDNIHPADAERVIGGLRKSIDSGQNFWAAEYRFRHGNGSYVYVLDRGYVERDEDGTAIRMIGAMLNISKRKWAEIELLESKERLTLAQQIANIGSFDWHFQTEKIVTSRQLEQIYGAAENFNNDFNYWLKFVHPDDVAVVNEDFQKALKIGELSNSFRIITTEHGLRWIQGHMKVFYDEIGEPSRIIGVNRDITEQKRAEAELQKSQEQLMQSQKLESVGRLAGGIAHDFNNMLTAINGYSELVLKNLKEDDPNRRKVLEIKKAGERSVDLTKQLLAFSRRQILQPKLIDLNAVISDMSQLLKRLIGEDIQLTIDLHKNSCCVMADPGQVSQVIMNLVVNSRDAMPEGGKLRIETTSTYVDKSYAGKHAPMIVGQYILLNVRDSGSGIDDETLQCVFEPFFTTKKNGTGLGLSTVYGIVKQSGGYIWVESEKGKGTSFNVFLPQVEEKLKSENPKTQEKHIASGSERILLVEDEETVRRLLSQILQTYGYQVIEASNGVEALRLCRENKLKIDLVLTDVIMPQMGGRKLTDELEKIYPQLKILFMSGYVGDKNLLGGKIIPEKNFVAKPITPSALADKVRQILDKKD
jgi:PAS domain S-box-containing protein